jgi:hypothetical protein
VCVCVCVCWCVWCACERLILVDDVTGRAGCSPCSQHRQAGASHTPSHASHTRYYYYTSLVNEISSVVTWLVAACTWRGAHRCPASPGTHRSKEKERFFFFALPQPSLHPHPHLPTHPLLLTHRRANRFTSVCHASWARAMTLVAHTIPHSQHARIRLEYEWFVSFATSQILRGMGTRCQHSLFLLSLLTPHTPTPRRVRLALRVPRHIR